MWIEAARDVQSAWRAHRFRRQLKAGSAIRAAMLRGLARLQALWRGRRLRRLLLQRRNAATRLQASVCPSQVKKCQGVFVWLYLNEPQLYASIISL